MPLKFQAIKPTTPNFDAFNKMLQDEARKWAKHKVKDFERVTEGWRGERPVWVFDMKGTNQFRIQVRIYIRNMNSKGAKKWIWLDLGTRRHRIRPKRANVLAFPSMHSAGSRPGSLFTIPATSGGETVFAKEVDHPGNEPRKWSIMLAKDAQPEFENWMRPVIARAARATGHQM